MGREHFTDRTQKTYQEAAQVTLFTAIQNSPEFWMFGGILAAFLLGPIRAGVPVVLALSNPIILGYVIGLGAILGLLIWRLVSE